MSRKKRSAKKKSLIFLSNRYIVNSINIGVNVETWGNCFAPYKGLAYALSLIKWVDPNGEYQKSYCADKVNYVLDILQRHGNLAQPELKKLIAQYLEIRQKRRESVLTSDQDFKKTYNIVSQIDALVKERYKELMWKD